MANIMWGQNLEYYFKYIYFLNVLSYSIKLLKPFYFIMTYLLRDGLSFCNCNYFTQVMKNM